MIPETMDAAQAAKFLCISKSTLAKITRPGNMLIEVSKPGGKKKVFQKKALMDYIEKYQSSI